MKKRSIPLFDILILLIAVCVVGVTVVKLTGSTAGGVAVNSYESTTPVVYTVSIPGVRQFTVDYINVGDQFYDDATGDYLGEIVDIEVSPYSTMEPDAQGGFSPAVMPERYVLTLTVSGNCTETTRGYYLSGTIELKSGTSLLADSKYVKTSFTILSILSVGGEEL